MGMCQIAQRRAAQTPCELWPVGNQPVGRAPGKTHYDHLPDRLGRKAAVAAVVHPKAVAGKAEFGDMAAAVSQQLAEADRTRHDTKPTIGLVILGVDLGITIEAATRADLFERDQDV